MPPAIPRATYRLQLTAEFRFDAAAAIAPYLSRLGISHVYASPFLKSRHGSPHGYDVVDHNVINPELGGEDGFERLSAALKRENLGLILDFVPNHMGVNFADNSWWLDVLEWGRSSPFASSFDIDWDLLPFRTRGGLLLPILGTSYGEALERGDIQLRFDEATGSFSAWYFEHKLPIAPERYSEILSVIVSEAGATETTAGQQLIGVAARYKGLRRPNRAQAPHLREDLSRLTGAGNIINRGLEAYRAGPDRPPQTSALHHLLERQHYKLAHWRLAASDINYRRFFDVNDLAGLRIEDVATFERTHRLIRRLISEDKIQGLRLDHIDGLYDPVQYCQRLQRLVRNARGNERGLFYLVVEKILETGEDLPHLAGVHGTTGYEWLNTITRVLVDADGLDSLDGTLRRATDIKSDFPSVLLASKQRVLDTLLASEFTVLARLLIRIANGHYTTRDFSADSLRQALELYVLHFPVYRTYIDADGPSAHDRALIDETIAHARAHWPGAEHSIFDFLRSVLTMDLAKTEGAATGRPRIRRFALKVQQFTGPLMAKSLEDTAFYRYPRLLALNEVGGDPISNGLSVRPFHAALSKRQKTFPHGLTATATHDTKRGEDARARLAALPELAGEWRECVRQWRNINKQHIQVCHGDRHPSPAFEYLLFQSLVGSWPLETDSSFPERFKAYAIKAAREGKLETSWLNPNAAYEDRVTTFIDRILDRSNREFLDSLTAFVSRLSLLGALNSLSQITLKATMPGVPDFYQGTEFWDLSLVDPDNRRPVDFASRHAVLDGIEPRDWPRLVENWTSGHLKLAWTKALLDIRRAFPDVFSKGTYQPLIVEGRDHDHVIAYAREYKGNAVIVAVGRHFADVTERGRHWPHRTFDAAMDTSAYTIDSIPRVAKTTKLPVAVLFEHFPAAIATARTARG
ncbi:MAG: malto-oligosyltrehalose synthase [Xanthobacteraceae bacterium]